MYNQYQGGKYKNPLEQAKEDYAKFKKDKEWFDFKANEKVAELIKQRDELNDQLRLINIYGQKYGYNINNTEQYKNQIKKITTELKKSKPLLELYKKNGVKVDNVKDFEQLINKQQLKTIEYKYPYPYSEPTITEEEEEEDIIEPMQPVSNIIIEEKKEPKGLTEYEKYRKEIIESIGKSQGEKDPIIAKIINKIIDRTYFDNSDYLKKVKMPKGETIQYLPNITEKEKLIIEQNTKNLINELNNLFRRRSDNNLMIFNYDENIGPIENLRAFRNRLNTDIKNIKNFGFNTDIKGFGYVLDPITYPIYSYYSYYF